MKEPFNHFDFGRTPNRFPTLAAFVAMAIAEWRTLVAEVSRAIAGARRNRATVERELFRGQYTLVSKNDDDLPVP